MYWFSRLHQFSNGSETFAFLVIKISLDVEIEDIVIVSLVSSLLSHPARAGYTKFVYRGHYLGHNFESIIFVLI